MVHRCCISSCGMNVRVAEAKGLSYHKFPTKEPIKDQWVQAIIPHLDKPESFKVVPRYTRICSRHFRKKDYCVDAKKRARLNSNAVPSVFPRKTTPLVIQSVLPTSPQLSLPKTDIKTEFVPVIITADNSTVTTNVGPTISYSSSSLESMTTATQGGITSVPPEAVITFDQTCSDAVVEVVTDELSHQDVDHHHRSVNEVIEHIHLGGLNELELTPEMFESVTIQNDHLVFTVEDPIHQETTLDQQSAAVAVSASLSLDETKSEDILADTKRRKRRKWNRTAFARPAKGKRKSLKTEPTVDKDGGDEDEDYEDDDFLNSQGDLALSLEHQGHSGGVDNDSVKHVSLLLTGDLPDQPYQSTSSSEDQELLKSIQAVSLQCVGDDVAELHLSSSTDDPLHQFNHNGGSVQLIPAFLHHHSSEESLYSNESHSLNNNVGSGVTEDLTVTQPDVGEDDTLRFELVDLRIDPDMPPVPPPNYLDIDELAQQLNSSLFTEGNIALFNHDSLNLNTESPPLIDELFIRDKPLVEKEKKPLPSSINEVEDSEKIEKAKKAKTSKVRTASNRETKKSPEKKLKGVSKRPKKDKVLGKFSVERFKNSDKDIEYYTGFNSYRNFEAFFRSLDAYIEKLCITDATYGINNLPTPSDDGTLITAESTSNASEAPKKRSCQGRSMSRINELFMTIIRLRRKLPEKVLGHMFFISQPTVSRTVRAWTVLLSKIIDSYPSSKPVPGEHSYGSKGLGIPDAFRDLFSSDLAKSIVVTSMSPKKMKSKGQKAKTSKKKSRN